MSDTQDNLPEEAISALRKTHIKANYVSHDVENTSLSQQIKEDAESSDILAVELSLYLGGFIPPEAPLDKIAVLMEPPSMFVANGGLDSLASMYYSGRNFPDSGRGHRRLFETMAQEILSKTPRRDLLQIVHELLYLRSHHADVIVYNEPTAWLRTVWYEADIMFHYAAAKLDFKLFGTLIYSDLDSEFANYIERSAGAIHAMTGDDVLIFSFGESNVDPELYTALDYVCYRCVMETPGRFDKPMPPADIDAMRARENRMLSNVRGKNKSLLFGRKLGVQPSLTPCIVFWASLDDSRFVTVPLGNHHDDKSRSMAVKRLAEAITSAVNGNGDVLDLLDAALSDIEPSHSGAPIGEILRQFLDQDNRSDVKDAQL
jgi:hypothetical protein